jgi:hypothetical protein
MKILPTLLAILLVATLAGAQTGPLVAVSESVLDAGVVPSGTEVSKTFVLENQGSEPLRILSVEPDCGCTVVRYDGIIAPGARGEISASVDVSTFVGPIAKYLTVRTNDVSNPVVTLTIKAKIQPEVQAHPGYARFLTVVGDDEMRAQQTIWSSTYEDFEVKGVRSPYDHLNVAFHEAVEGERLPEGEGRQWVVEMVLSADAPIGPMADYVTLTTNNPEMSVMRIPVSGFVRPILAVSPPFADFGTRELTRPIIASVEVKNFSDKTISLISATADLPQLEVEIEPDDTDHYVIIRLSPGLPKGDFSGMVTVETDSPDVPVLKIEVKGRIR